MSNSPPQEPPAQGLSSESGHTLPSRLLQPTSDPSVSKRVCFYKSGDYKFSGHRMVINARTFKTFDALLDALSKKVPLPFGVRTITTPRGTHFVKGLEDLYDGGSYVCSDQKRVKPLNLDEVNRRQVPWNTTRLLSTGRQQRPGPQLGQFGRRNEAPKRPAKVNERAAVRTPKRLTVIKNKDPMVKRTIVLQRRTAPSFEALLDYLSQILQFPVLKLYSMDGRRVDGLAALILCSGVVVAAGNEPFRLGNYSFHQTGQMFMEIVESSMLRPPAYNNKSLSSGRGSKNFSQSSERYIVNQINASRNGITNNNLHHNNDSFETEINQRQMSLETCGTAQADNDHCPCIVPQDNDIEKSFCVNQDGSMTVEMKVRLTIKEEEMLHWTTTLSRTSLSKRTVCPLVSELGSSSPDSNNAVAKNSSSISEDEAKEENHPTLTERGVGFNNEQLGQDYTSTPLEKTKPRFKRPPTPGPRHGKKKSSVDSVKMVTESAVQESTMGHYSYMARTADGGTAEGYCVVRHSSSSSSKRPIPRPRKTSLEGTKNKGSTFSMKSTGVAEVLQIENNGIGVRETVMHIYESEGCHDNYFANEQYSVDSVPLHDSSPVPGSKPSTDCGSRLSSNDCDIDSTWQPPIADSQQRQKEEIFSLSSEPMSPAHKIANDLSSVTVNETQAEATSRIQFQRKDKVKDNAVGEQKKVIKLAKKQNSSSLTSSSEKKPKETIISPLKNIKKSSSDKISSKASVGKKTSSESAQSGQKNKAVEKPQIKKFSRDDKTPSKEKALLANIENVKRTPFKNTSKAALKENGHNVNIPETKTGRSQMKKNISKFLQPKRSLLAGKKTVSKPKSMAENRAPSPKKSLELNESVSMPLLNPSPSEIHQYVENWLEKVSPDAVPYTEETGIYTSGHQKKVLFQIGGESESEEKNEKQSNPEDCCPLSDGAIKKSGSCLSAPLCHEEQQETVVHSQQMARGSCVSMPTFRVEPEHQENPLRSHKSAEATGPAGDKSPSSTHNTFSSKAKMKPVLEKICLSMECIRRVSDTNVEKSNSLSDFPTQVASVFGSSCKAFLSFLSVMSLRDSLTDVTGDGNSEAMLMMKSLQKISVIENEEEQRASLTDLQNKASSQFRERWKDFQILREQVESEAMPPKISETEFPLEVTSEGGDVFDESQLDIDELMHELNLAQDLREEISSTIQQVKSFYLTESTLAKPANQSPELNSTSEGENRNEIMSESEQKPELVKQETVFDFKETELRDESLTEKENEVEGKEEENQVDDGDREDDDTEKIEDVAQEIGKTEQERGEETEEEENNEENRDTEQDEAGSGNEEEEESIEKVGEGTEKDMAVDESEDNLKGEIEVNDEIDHRVTDEEDQEGTKDNSVDRQAVEGHTTEESEEEKDEKTMERNNKSQNILGERDEEAEMEDSIKERDEEEENVDVIGEKEEEEGIQNIIEVIEEKDGDNETEDTISERGEEEEAGNIILYGDDEERPGNLTGEVGEEGVEDINRDIDEEEESKSITGNEEEQREDSIKEGDEETETEDNIQARDEEEESENITGEREQEEEIDDVIEEEGEEEEEEEAEVISEESEEEEDVNEGDEGEHKDKVEDEDGEDEEVKSKKGRMITDHEEEDDKHTEEEEESDEDGETRKEMETTAMSVEEESIVEDEQNHLKAGQTLDEEEKEDDEEEAGSAELNEGCDNEVDSLAGGQASENLLLEEASYLHQRSGSCDEDQAHSHSDKADLNTDSPTKYHSEGQSAEEKDNGTDSANELEADERGEGNEERSGSLPHPVEVSQELLDFVNSALKSSSLIFTYDSQGNVRIEPDRTRTVQTKQSGVRKRTKDSSYGFKCLPSPSTSDLSDYRPESSGSGGYKTQDSLDIVTESGEEASERPFPVCRHSVQKNNIPSRKTSVERASSKFSKSAKSFSTGGSGTKASREDLSYFSAASSLKADSEPAMEAAQCMSFPSEKHSPDDGVLIDHGRWLLKENHLIRKSPPVSIGMYGQLENTSIDSASEDSPSHSKTQHSPLAAISSSELEEMAKPQTPKCAYFNMPHGSDSDPFMDDASVQSGKNCASSFKGRGVKVSPTVDTSKTWANKNGSMSSFASVEFKIPDRKVHPEAESSAVTQARRTPSARGGALQAQDSLETLHLRCGQYCPIL